MNGQVDVKDEVEYLGGIKDVALGVSHVVVVLRGVDQINYEDLLKVGMGVKGDEIKR